MRNEEESCLSLEVANERMLLFIGGPKQDGCSPCHLVGAASSVAFHFTLGLDGRMQGLSGAPEVPRDRLDEVASALDSVSPQVWQDALMRSLHRRLKRLEANRDEALRLAEEWERYASTAARLLAALECPDPQQRAVLAVLAPTWEGSVGEMLLATEHATLP